MREQEREHFHGAEESGESADFAVVPEHITPPPPSASLPPFAMAGQARFSAGGPRTTTGTAGKRTGRGSSPGAGGSKRRSRKEPLRHDFDNEAEYAEAYSQWREFRAKQAESVNRSRSKAKQIEYEQDLKIRVTEHENQMLERRIAELQANIELYRGVLAQSLDTVDGLLDNDFDNSLEVLLDDALAA